VGARRRPSRQVRAVVRGGSSVPLPPMPTRGIVAGAQERVSQGQPDR